MMRYHIHPLFQGLESFFLVDPLLSDASVYTAEFQTEYELGHDRKHTIHQCKLHNQAVGSVSHGLYRPFFDIRDSSAFQKLKQRRSLNKHHNGAELLTCKNAQPILSLLQSSSNSHTCTNEKTPLLPNHSSAAVT